MISSHFEVLHRGQAVPLRLCEMSDINPPNQPALFALIRRELNGFRRDRNFPRLHGAEVKLLLISGCRPTAPHADPGPSGTGPTNKSRTDHI